MSSLVISMAGGALLCVFPGDQYGRWGSPVCLPYGSLSQVALLCVFPGDQCVFSGDQYGALLCIFPGDH